MKVSVSRWVGDLSLSADIELDAASAEDVKFSRTVISGIMELPEEKSTITLQIDGEKLKEELETFFGNEEV